MKTFLVFLYFLDDLVDEVVKSITQKGKFKIMKDFFGLIRNVHEIRLVVVKDSNDVWWIHSVS